MEPIAPTGGKYISPYAGPSAADIFKARGGTKLGPSEFLVRCPCPVHKHGDRNPSLHASGRPGERPRLHCYGGGDWREIAAMLGADINHTQPVNSSCIAHDPEEALKRRMWQAQIVREIITTSEPITGTIAEDYLRLRGVMAAIDDSARMSILYHKGLRFGSNGNVETAPGMVCIMRPFVETMNAAFDTLEDKDGLHNLMRRRDLWTAIHRTRLTYDGYKHSRSFFATSKGAVIFVDDPFSIAARQIVSVAEGVETALSARLRGFNGIIAAGSTGAIAALPVVGGIIRINLIAEDDPASRKAIEQCAERWDSAGAEVRLIRPREGLGDLNDADRRDEQAVA